MELVKYIVNSETDLNEDGVDKVIADLSVVISISGNEVSIPLKVVNLNSQTGAEMDAQREQEVNNFISTLK